MPRLTNLLDIRTIESAIASGKSAKLRDGASLYLWLRGGSSLWIFHYRDGENMRTRSLGSYPQMTPNAARKARNVYASTRERDGTKEMEASSRERFNVVLEDYLARYMPEWKPSNREREAKRYRRLLETSLAKMWVDEIETQHVAAALMGRWGDALASADKARMCVMQVLAYAVAKKLRKDGENPARKEVMKHLVPNAPKSVPHHAMPLADIPAFVRELRADGSPSSRALGFAILTAARTTEAIGAGWAEIEGNVWNIPAGRMKEGKAHSVPLPKAALALLGKPQKSGLIFGKLPHDALIDRLKLAGDFTTHGFRSAFVGWAAKQGIYSKELIDRAIAHAAGSANDQAYHRETLTAERRPMMAKWADYLTR